MTFQEEIEAHDRNVKEKFENYPMFAQNCQMFINGIDIEISDAKKKKEDAINGHIDNYAILYVGQIYKIKLPNKHWVEIEVKSIEFGPSLADADEIIYKVIELHYTKKGDRRKDLRIKEYPQQMVYRCIEIKQLTNSDHYKNPRNQ